MRGMGGVLFSCTCLDCCVCFAGLDLSASRDLTALVLVFPQNDQLHVVPHFWLPEDGLRDKAQSEKVPGIYGPTKVI